MQSQPSAESSSSSSSSRNHARRHQSSHDQPPSPVSPLPSLSGAFPSASTAYSAMTRCPGGERSSTRIVRTFEEVQVPKTISKEELYEELYEELDCGICSHILAAPQALVPCGHSFCGPCAWQWIRTNRNFTCPHCRMEVSETTPFVPNIVVDQIIERKLHALHDSPQIDGLRIERQEKTEEWKSLRASLSPSKPARRQSRGFDEWVSGFFEPARTENTHNVEGSRRRASRHFAELGAPLPHARRSQLGSTPGGMSLGDIRRMEAEEDALLAIRMAEIRRRRQDFLQDHTGPLEVMTEDPEDYTGSPPRSRILSISSLQRPPLSIDPSTQSRTNSLGTSSMLQGSPSTGQSRTDPVVRSSPRGRPTPLRSQALAGRQARGRSGTRDQHLVVLSDSEGD